GRTGRLADPDRRDVEISIPARESAQPRTHGGRTRDLGGTWTAEADTARPLVRLPPGPLAGKLGQGSKTDVSGPLFGIRERARDHAHQVFLLRDRDRRTARSQVTDSHISMVVDCLIVSDGVYEKIHQFKSVCMGRGCSGGQMRTSPRAG